MLGYNAFPKIKFIVLMNKGNFYVQIVINATNSKYNERIDVK